VGEPGGEARVGRGEQPEAAAVAPRRLVKVRVRVRVRVRV